MDALARDLSVCGLRVTAPRLAIYAWLREHPVHPTAETIWQALLPAYPRLSLTTVYNTVNALSENGLIRSVTIHAGEQRFDGNPCDHGHFRCRACGRVLDFELASRRGKVPALAGCRLEKYDLFVTGLCEECAG